MKNKVQTRLNRSVVLILCFAMLLVLTGCGKNPVESETNLGSAEEVIAQLAQQSTAYGFDNALSELTEQNKAAVDGDSYYRLQQNYQGIPVYGKTLVYVTDEKGNTISITGNVQDVDETIDLTPTISADTVLSVVNQFFTDTFGPEVTAIDSLDLSENDLCIFEGSTDQKSHLAYVIAKNGYELVVDAHDGSLLQSNCLLRWATVQDLEGQIASYENVLVSEENGEYRLTDEDRKLTSFQAKHTEMSKLWGLIKYQVNINNEADEIVWQDGGNPPADAVDAYVNTQIAYDYFDQVLGNTAPDGEGLGQVLLLTGIQYTQDENGEISSGRMNNAASGTDLEGKATLLYFGVGTDGTPARSAYCDWVAHEYMHAVEAYHSSMIYDGESGAIMEGLSDIFGELVESWATRQDPNWIFSETDRNMRDPGSGGYPASISDENRSNEDYVHGYSTVVSHAAYLMWNGIDGNNSKKLSNDELAELWYRAVLMMPSDCDFILCRQLVEVAAQSMEVLDDEQRDCVREAFNRVGIPSTREDTFYADYHLNEDATLTVYDQNNELYSGYTLRINGTIDMSEIASNMTPDVGWVVNRTNTVEEAGAYVLDLPQGCYALTITDPHYDESYTIYVEISDEHTETNIDLITAYEEPLVVVIPELDYENLVTDAYQDAFADDDGFEYCYHIPQFNLRGNWAQQINKTIYDQCYAILDQNVYDSMDEYGYPDIADMVYCWGYHGDYASVVIETNATWWADTEYSVFTISTSDGKNVSMDELLSAYGMDQNTFHTLVHDRLKQYWDEQSDIRDNVGSDFFDDRVTKTLSDSNIRNAIPFINPNGELSFVANIYSLAAGDSYLHLINADGTLEMGYLECTKDHSADGAEPTGDVLQYFIENCDQLYFTESDIQDFDDEMCMYARNAIFAKSGRKFQSQQLQDYFGKYSWYVPSVEPDNFSEDMLNRKQLANLALVQAREEALEIESLVASLDGEAGIYTRYLHNGGYDELLGQERDKTALEVSSCLADLDNDGTDELFLSLGTGQSGIRGKETYTFLLDIESNQVYTVVESYFGGGSEGGDNLAIKFDSVTQTHVLVLEGYMRDGVEAYGSYMDVYSMPNFKVGMELNETYYSLYNNWYKENVDKVRSETTLFYEDGYDFRYYQIDGQYVTEETFDKAWARYEEPKDGYQLKTGTYACPIS